MVNTVTDLLKNIMDPNKGDEQLINDCIAFYRKYKRHYYYEISLFLLDIMKKGDDGNDRVEENIEFLTTRIASFIEMTSGKCAERDEYSRCKEQESYNPEKCPRAYQNCKEYKSVSLSLRKLYDHIQLEHARLEQTREYQLSFKEISATIMENLEESKQHENSTKELSEFVNKEIEKFDKSSSELGKKAEDLEKQTENVYVQVVTVIGLFTAIVFSMFGGLTMINTIVQMLAANKIGFIKGTSICLLVGLVIFDILYLLLYLISKLIGRSIAVNARVNDDAKFLEKGKKLHPLCYYFNLAVIIAVVFLAIAYNFNFIKGLIPTNAEKCEQIQRSENK